MNTDPEFYRIQILFNDSLSSFSYLNSQFKSPSKQVPTIKRNRKYFSLKRNIKKIVAPACIGDPVLDDRPHPDVDIAGISFCGFLDSGANITVLGDCSEEFLCVNRYFYLLLQEYHSELLVIIGLWFHLMGNRG